MVERDVDDALDPGTYGVKPKHAYVLGIATGDKRGA
jgi:hypothetical protein